MTETTTPPDQQRVPNDRDALNADIEDARTRLGDTVDEIGHRLDVRTRLKGATQRLSTAGRERSVMIGGAGLVAVAVVGIMVLARRRRGRDE
jgi:hypothetical protein